MSTRTKGNAKNGAGRKSVELRSLCWRAGFDGVSGLATHLGVHRGTVSRAWRWPDQFGPTHQKILKALNIP